MNGSASTKTDLQTFEAVARDAARAGGAFLRERFRTQEWTVEQKGMHDYVTEVDRGAEERVLAVLRGQFPEHEVMAEESAPNAAKAPYRWVVDPLDGTTNFIHGVPTFSVSIALEDPDGLAAGVIYEPIRDEMFHGHRGGGAFLNDEPIRCSTPPGVHDCLLATGFPYKELSRLGPYLSAFEQFVRSVAGIRRAGSAAIDLAYVAAGRYDGFWEIGLSRWDIAAGALLVQEAGGIVTDLSGGATALDCGDLVAAGPSLHEQMLKVTRQAFGG